MNQQTKDGIILIVAGLACFWSKVFLPTVNETCMVGGLIISAIGGIMVAWSLRNLTWNSPDHQIYQ